MKTFDFLIFFCFFCKQKRIGGKNCVFEYFFVYFNYI